jgi:hypothetical protein
MKQYLRKVRMTVKGSGGTMVINPGGLDGPQIKIDFDIQKGVSSTQNSATIKVYNLKEAHRNMMGKELDDVTLEAGYMPPGEDGNVGIIFTGQMRDVEHKRDGENIITEFSCGDGDKALRKATISKTYKAGTEVKEVVNDIQKELEKEGIKKGEWKFPDDISQKKFKRPYSVCGSCKSEMDTLGKGKDFFWSIQNGVTEIIPGKGYIGETVLLTPESGLVGTPTITDNGCKVTALLNPQIRPNRRVQIKAQTLEMNSKNGEYRVSECRYSGNNYDGDMIVHITGESISDKKVDEGKGQDK